MGYGIDDGPASFTTNLTERLAIGILIRIREPRISTATIHAQRPNSSSLPPPFSRGYKRSVDSSTPPRVVSVFTRSRFDTLRERGRLSTVFSSCLVSFFVAEMEEEGGGRTGEGGGGKLVFRRKGRSGIKGEKSSFYDISIVTPGGTRHRYR